MHYDTRLLHHLQRLLVDDVNTLGALVLCQIRKTLFLNAGLIQHIRDWENILCKGQNVKGRTKNISQQIAHLQLGKHIELALSTLQDVCVVFRHLQVGRGDQIELDIREMRDHLRERVNSAPKLEVAQ